MTAIEHGFYGFGVGVRGFCEQLARGGVFEENVRAEGFPRIFGEGYGGLDDAEAAGEDLTLAVVGGPGGGGVAFIAGERGDVIDVDGGGDEEDALDCVGGEGGGGGGGGCHWESRWGS